MNNFSITFQVLMLVSAFTIFNTNTYKSFFATTVAFQGSMIGWYYSQ